MGIFTATESRADQRQVYLPQGCERHGASLVFVAGRAFCLGGRNGHQQLAALPPRAFRRQRAREASRSAAVPVHGRCLVAGRQVDVFLCRHRGGVSHLASNLSGWFARAGHLRARPRSREFHWPPTAVLSSPRSVRSRVRSGFTTRSVIARLPRKGTPTCPCSLLTASACITSSAYRANRRFVSGELWAVDLESGARERLLPEFLMEHYSLAPDGPSIVFIALDDAGHSPVWIAPLDGSSPPRKLTSLDCVRALFGAENDVYFVGGETTAMPFLYHVNTDGSALRRIISISCLFLYDVSPDGKWLAVWERSAIVLYSSDGATRKMYLRKLRIGRGRRSRGDPAGGKVVERREASVPSRERHPSRGSNCPTRRT